MLKPAVVSFLVFAKGSAALSQMIPGGISRHYGGMVGQGSPSLPVGSSDATAPNDWLLQAKPRASVAPLSRHAPTSRSSEDIPSPEWSPQVLAFNEPELTLDSRLHGRDVLEDGFESDFFRAQVQGLSQYASA